MFQELERNDKTVILFGGAGNVGKTWGACSWIVIQSLRYPKTVWGLARSRLITLKKTSAVTLQRVLKSFNLKENVNYTFNHEVETITFWNGSKIILFDCYQYPTDMEFERLGSLELSGCIIDEASEVTEKAYNVIQSRIRFLHKEFNLTPKLLIVTNPTQNFIKSQIYDRYVDGTLPPNVSVILGLPTDNIYTDQSYIDNLERLDNVTKARLLYGDWNYADNDDSIFNASKLANAYYNSNFINKSENKYMSVDVASTGGDSTVISIWSGLECYEILKFQHITIPQINDKITTLLKDHSVPVTNLIVDSVGIGLGVSQAFRGSVAFVANAKAVTPIYNSLKDELYYKLADLINNDAILISTKSQKDELIQELSSHKMHKYDQDSAKTQVTPKALVKAAIGRSPDVADSIMMRMYFESKPSSFSFTFV